MWDIVAGAEGNITSGFTWEPQPERRGTFGIITTCLVTLALCTWKIVHLNLPGTCPDENLPWSAWFKKGTTHSMRHRLVHIFGGHQLTRQIGWLLIGLFAPELIAYAAFRQYWDVRSLQAFMELVYLQPVQPRRWWPAMLSNRRPQPEDVEDNSTKPIWTLTHSWYAVMGGYSYKLRDGPKVFLPDDHNREQLVLRDEALRFVAEHEPAVIPHLSVLDILDKSSASTFVKIITLFQALWFSLQCIVRMAQGLSISLLELTTFAHCIVALIIGWLWLRKPVDISKPDPLEMPDTVSQPHWLMAVLYSLTSFDRNECDEDRYRKLGPAEQNAVENAGEGQRMSTYLDATINQDPITFSDLNLQGGRPQSSAVSMGRPTTAAPSRPNTSLPTPPSPQTHLFPPSQVQTKDSPAQSLSELVQAAADQERRFRIRMQLAQKGWDHYILDRHPHEEPANDTATTTAASLAAQSMSAENRQREQRRLKRTMRNTLVDRVTNFPRRRHDAPKEQHTFRTHLGISLTGFLYGGLHMLAWDASFTSQAEADIWKLASISLACSGLLVPITHAEGVILNAVKPWLMMDEDDRDAEEAEHLAEKAAKMGRWKHGWRHYWWKLYKWCFLWMIEVIRVCKVFAIVVVACIYFGLRFFIFVECLANLSHLPSSAYDVVRWSQYVPHIS
ncbi:hypothetical protein J7T55_007924 [Diaporthe amygdali]|uniref:uncharacterized protein n=1 Tax=Phomopsis amygdali TaxID=1214568 RepID=UPI0022FE5D38|nr:uncharacterized protein J7T55_007924 [Diaporthe amygdali]KAJ0114090.1 hypothetical protein J7T55_007924 [Diaporthe amygdali]